MPNKPAIELTKEELLKELAHAYERIERLEKELSNVRYDRDMYAERERFRIEEERGKAGIYG